MRAASLLAMISLVCASIAEAADTRPPKPAMQPEVPPYELDTQVFDFPTGLRVMFQADRSYPVVSVYMIVNHGSAEDPEGKEETAHFVEHTWFRSKHGELPPIMDVVQDISGVFNASTWNDWTNYSTVANADYLPILLRLESLRLTEFYKGMTEETFLTEREVIRNEWRRRNENQQALLFDYTNHYLWPANHPYHSTSTHASIDNLKLADLTDYVDKHYLPSETTLMIVGDFDGDDASSLIFENMDPTLLHPGLTKEMQFFYPRKGIDNPDQANPDHWHVGYYDPEEFAKGNKVPFKYVDPSERKPRVTTERPEVPALGSTVVGHEEAPVDYPIAIVAWSLPGGYRDDHWNLQVLGNLAGSVMLSGLQTQYQEKQLGLAESGCFAQPEVLATTLMCLVEVRDSAVRPEDMVEKMLDQFATLWNPDLAAQAERDFSRARNEFLSGELLNLDTFASVFGGRADSIGTFAHLTGDPKYYQRMFEQYASIDVGVEQKIAYQYMKRDRAARLVVEPLPEDEVDTLSDASGYIGASNADDMLRTSDDLSKVDAAEIAAARVRPDVSKIVDFKLQNGLRVVIMPHGEAPTAQVSLLLGGGEGTEAPYAYDFTSWFIQGEANDPLQIAASSSWPYLEGIAGLWAAKSYPMVGADVWGNASRLNVRAPAGNIGQALWILRGEVEGMKPYAAGATEWKSDRKDSLESNWGKRSWHIGDITSAHLYPGSAYHGSTTWEMYLAAKEFDGGTIDQWLDRHINPDNATLLIVGRIDPAEARKSAEEQFGGWQGRAAGNGWAGKLDRPGMPTGATRVLIFDDPKKTQSETSFECRLNYTDESQRPAVGVLGSLLGSQTFQTLRVEEALSYTPYAYASISDDGAAILGFGSLALNKGVGRTVEFFIQAAKEVEGGKVNAQEITQHKLRMAREAGINSQSSEQMVGTLTGPLRRGEDWSRIQYAGEDIAKVSPEAVVALIQGCSDHAIITIEGPKDVITEQLKAKNIPYEIVDWEARGDELLGKYDPKELKKKLKKKAKSEKKKAKESEDEPAPEPTTWAASHSRDDD